MTTFFQHLHANEYHSSEALYSTLATHKALPAHQDHVLTIVGQALTPFLVSNVIQALTSVFVAKHIAPHALHQAFGDDVVVLHGDCLESDDALVKSQLDHVAATYHVDVGLQTSQPILADGGLLVMDMDSTVIAIECIDEIAKLAGVGEEVAEVTARAMRGEIAFNESLHHRVACLQGVPVAHLESIRNSIPIMPGIQRLLSVLKQHNWKLAIASGGFTYFADHLKQRLGLDYAISNTLVEDNGKLVGKVAGEVVNAEVKARTVKELAEKWNIDTSQTVAMGDGANDLVMMAESGLGVACHGKPVVNKQADVAIRFGGLHAMLYFLK
ncbi:phosphoserine phosphatase SerB [Alteromonas sp.]|nr:phosphoserine phosphatase SerB [Alteromonas sp.]